MADDEEDFYEFVFSALDRGMGMGTHEDWIDQSAQYHLAGVVTSIAAHQAGDRLERHLENALASMVKALWVYAHA